MAKKQTRTASKTAKKNRLPLFVLSVLLIVLLIAGMFACAEAPSEKKLLEIDGFSVFEEEYRWAMYAARDDILSALSEIGVAPVQWESETPLGVPCQLIAERAVELLREYYAVSTLAVERGYLSDAGFSALQKQREADNAARESAISAGEHLTGLRSYDLPQYIQYRADAIRRQYCDDKSIPEMNITEEELRLQYERDKDALYVQQDDLILCYIDVSAAEAGLSEDALLSELTALRAGAQRLGSLEEALAEHPLLQGFYQTAEIDDGTYAAYARAQETLLLNAQSLRVGELSEVAYDSGSYLLIECVQRVARDYISFESLRSVLERSVQEEKYDTLIAQRTAAIAAEYNAELLYRYTAEQLG